MTDAQLDELLTFRWPVVMRRVMAECSEEFPRNFVRSIARHGKRAGWRPSIKQERIMRQMLADWSGPDDNMDLIER